MGMAGEVSRNPGFLATNNGRIDMGEQMSCNDDGILFRPATEGEPTVLVPIRVLKELTGMSIQLLSVLEFHVPDDGHRLQVLADEVWVDWPSLEEDLINWIGASV